MHSEPSTALWDRELCGTVFARDQTCRAAQWGAPHTPLPTPRMFSLSVSTIPQLHSTVLPSSGGSSSSSLWLLGQANNLLLGVKVCPAGSSKGSIIQTTGRARVWKEKPNNSDFAQLHCPAAEFVLYFVHCYWSILKGVCGGCGFSPQIRG